MKRKKLLIEVLSALRMLIFLSFSVLFVLPSVILSQDGTDFRIQTPSTALQDAPRVVYNTQNDEFFVTWRDYRNGFTEVFGRRVLSTGSVQGNQFNISGGRDARNSCVAYISSTNKYLTVYERYIGGSIYYNSDLWYQFVNPDGSFPPNTWGQLTGYSYDATFPAIAYNSATDMSLLVWSHNINKPSPIQGDGQIYGQRVDKNGHTKGLPFLISTSSGGQYFIGFADVCASPNSNNFLVCWIRLNQVYGQRIEISQDTLTSPLKGQNFSITQTASAMGPPQIIYNSTDNEYLVIWEDNRNGYREIFGRRVGANSGLPSLSFSISGPSQTAGTDLFGESGAYNSNDNSYFIWWRDWEQPDKYSMRGCYLDKNGQVMGSQFTINDAPIIEDKIGIVASYRSGAAYSPDKNKFFATWVHNLTGNNHEIYGDMIDSYTATSETIIIDVPNGGETWEASQPQPIVWHTQNFTGNVKIELSTDGGTSWTTIANNVPTPTANTATSYMWTVSSTPSTQCRIRISDASDGDPFDISDANFTITSNPSIIVDVPNGGENWAAGTPQPIVWHTHIFTGNVKIELSTNNGSSWTTIANNVPTPTANAATSYMWTVSNTPSSNCLVRISNASSGNPSDVSNNTFTIDPPGTNNTPTGANVAVVLSSDVTVTFDNVTGAGTTTLNKKNIGSPPPGGFTIIPSGAPLYYDINTTATYTGNITISIKYDDTGMTPAQEQSLKLQVYEMPPGSWKDITTSKDMNANIISGEVNHLTDFAVMMTTGSGTESITVVSPNGGEVWPAGSEQEILWTSTDFTGQVRIEGSIDGGSTFEEIAASTNNNGTFLFSVPNEESNTCVIKISDASDGDPFDVSDAFFTISAGPIGEEIIVTNTDDSGPGSLRDAIDQANNSPGENFILFQIPKTDPGYDMDAGVWTIRPQSKLPTITGDPLILDGFSQSNFIGDDTNPFGPEIEISGSDAGENVDGLNVNAPNVMIIGLILNNFSHAGIMVTNSEGGRISGCYIGTDFSGMEAAPNIDGIWLYDSQGFHVSPEDTLPNIISGNRGTAIYLNNSTHSFIFGNIIGLKATKLDTLGNLCGICIQEQADSNEVAENRICGNNGYGIYIFGSNANFIVHNFIGRHEDPEIQLGNTKDGIMITENSQNNMILENMIGHNGSNGVFVFGNQAIRNTISRNSITHNSNYGIENRNGGNIALSPPQIQNVTHSSISGTAPANSIVEIFFDLDDEGELFIADIPADASGSFSWSGEEIPPDFYVTATATDTEGNTSQFSNAVKSTIRVENENSMQKPVHFALHQNYPNPFNPATTISYAVAKNSHVKLTVYNTLGQVVAVLVDGFQLQGSYNLKWDAHNQPSGLYFYRLEADGFSATKKMFLQK